MLNRCPMLIAVVAIAAGRHLISLSEDETSAKLRRWCVPRCRSARFFPLRGSHPPDSYAIRSTPCAPRTPLRCP